MIAKGGFTHVVFALIERIAIILLKRLKKKLVLQFFAVAGLELL